MEFIFLLGQADAVLETAEKGLGTLERLQAGGVPLISLCIAVVCGLAFYWQLRRNITQAALELEKAEKREGDKDEATKTRLSEQESLLREMLDRDRESQEAQMAAVQAVQGITHAMNEQKLETNKLKQTISNFDARFKDLEDILRRRFRDA